MFERLIKLIRKEQVSLFVGAGFSLEAGAPSVNKLKKLILDEFDDNSLSDRHQEDSLAELSEFFVETVCNKSRNNLIEILKGAFAFTPLSMSDHNKLVKIPHFKNIFTTNYDTLLEDSYNIKDRCVIRHDKDCAYTSNKPVSIYKIHGDFTEPDSVVITSSDYKAFWSTNRNPILWNKVTTEFAEKSILFLAYGLEDNNIIDIIKNVSDSLLKNQKEMFLIAPNWNEEQIKTIEHYNVKYYNATADVFLTELISELEKHISDDFRDGLISQETHARFWANYNATPTVTTPLGGKNVINAIQSTNGELLEHTIQMTVTSEYKELLDKMDFDKYGECNQTPHYTRVPCLKLTGEKLLECKHFVNGVVFNSSIKEVIVFPAEQNFDLNIRIPSRGFFEQTTAKAYRLSDNHIRLMLDCHIFDMEINICSSNENEVCNISFSFESRKTYSNNDEAIKWIDLISAFFSKEDVIMNEISSFPLNIAKIGNQIPHHYEEHKLYYRNLKKIELLTGKKFKKYSVYTEELYEYSRIVLSYLEHQYIPVHYGASKKINVTTSDIDICDINKKVVLNELISIVSTNTDGTRVSINGRDFHIPFKHQVYDKCLLKGLSVNDNGEVDFEVEYSKDKYYILYSDNSAEIEYPDLKSIGELVTSKIKNKPI